MKIDWIELVVGIVFSFIYLGGLIFSLQVLAKQGSILGILFWTTITLIIVQKVNNTLNMIGDSL